MTVFFKNHSTLIGNKKKLNVIAGLTNVDVTQDELQKIFSLIMVSFNFKE